MAAENRALSSFPMTDGFVYLSGRSKLATGAGVVKRTLAGELRALNVRRPVLVMGGR